MRDVHCDRCRVLMGRGVGKTGWILDGVTGEKLCDKCHIAEIRRIRRELDATGSP